MIGEDVDASGGRARPEPPARRILGAHPGAFRIRLRVPSMRADQGDPGTVTVEVLVGEPPIPLDGCQLMELTFSWGASSDAGVVTTADAGSATVRLVDPDRIFDPTNSASHFAGIGTVIRIVLNGVIAFRGRIDNVQHDLTVATLSLVDGVALLASVQFVETNVPAESSSARVTRILDLASWPTDRRDIGSGGVNLQAGTVSSDAWSELVDVTRNELGALWLTADGKVAWRNRATAWSPPSVENVPNWSFETVDNPAAQYPYPIPWANYPDGGYVVGQASASATNGARVLWLGTYGTSHFVYQDIAVVPGQTYRLSAAAGRDGAGTSSVSVVAQDATAGYATLATLTFSNPKPLIAKALTFVAPSALVRVAVIAPANPPNEGWLFDAVSLASPGDPVMTFGCEPSDAFIGSMTTRADQGDLVNVLAAARRTGTQAVRTDSPSLAIYGRHSHVQNDLEVASDGERDLWMDFYLVRQANPTLGIAGFDTRPDSAALSRLLALPLGAIVRVYDEHHGPLIDRRARWLGAKWKVAPGYVEVDAITGEDASIRQVARTTAIDTPAQWTAAAGSAADEVNVAYREPGAAPATLPSG